MKRTLTAIALVAAITAPAFAADDAKSIAQQLGEKWIEAYNKGDAANLAALYTSDAVLLPQGSPKPITGHANILKFFEEAAKQPKLDNLSLPVTDAKMLDSKTMYGAGTWTANVPGEKGAPSAQASGTYLFIGAHEGNEWRFRADTWNMMPPPGSQPATATGSTTSGYGSTTPKQ